MFFSSLFHRGVDIAAGQLIDRAGQALGLQFPSGRELDALSKAASVKDLYKPKINGTRFSLSGVEHKMHALIDSGASKENAAYFTLASMIWTVGRVTENAKKIYGDLPVLFSGGVASNSLLRELTPEGIFAEPRYSTDNAMGAAILTYRSIAENG